MKMRISISPTSTHELMFEGDLEPDHAGRVGCAGFVNCCEGESLLSV